MNIAVLGLGGVGGFFGGKLAYHYSSTKDVQVAFIARGEHLKKIIKQGLRVITVDGNFVANPDKATDDPEKLGAIDLILFCVKGYDLESGARAAVKNLGKQSVAIPLLNGVDNAARLTSLLPDCQVLNGCVYLSSQIVEPGVVQQVGGPGQLLFGPKDGNTRPFAGVEQLLREAGIRAELKPNIDEIVWEKYIFISPMAGATSLFVEPLGVILEKEDYRELLMGLIREVVQLAREKGVGIAEDIVERTIKTASSFPPQTKSSMQLDFEKGKRTELETLVGYVVKAAQDLDLDLPHYRMVYSKLRQTEKR